MIFLNSRKNIPFSPPDISSFEIRAVRKVLRSGWITTGPKVLEFEKLITEFCGVDKAVCLNSATAGMELLLHLFQIGPGDEVITTPYTFAATANIIVHTGAKVVFADIKKDQFNIDPDQILKKITAKTKAIIAVDFAGLPCDYDKIREVLIKNSSKFNPRKNSMQQQLTHPLFIIDAAHSFGSFYKNKRVGAQGDFTVFSFHAVKNLTTGEGGVITFKNIPGISSNQLTADLKRLALHGQSIDAFTKINQSSCRYDIVEPGFKFNMTDIQAALGISQLKRYDSKFLPKRKKLFEFYNQQLKDCDNFILPENESTDKISNYHLYPLRIKNYTSNKRDQLIIELKKRGINTNIHFIPLPMHSYYKKCGYSIKDYPNAEKMYSNEITLPLYTNLRIKDVKFICSNLKSLTK